MRRVTVLGLALAMAYSLAAPVSAANLVVNGNFTDSSLGMTPQGTASQLFLGNEVTGWTTGTSASQVTYWIANANDPITNGIAYHGYNHCFYGPGNCNGGGRPSGNLQNGWAAPPVGPGTYLALDADPTYTAPVYQTLNDLTPGQTYTLSFDWASAEQAFRAGGNPQANLTASLNVQVGQAPDAGAPGYVLADDVLNQTVTNNYCTGFSSTPACPNTKSFAPWATKTFQFTADQSSEVLQFLATGGTSGAPPMALLTGVKVEAPGVPEPASWVLMICGLGLAGRALRRVGPARQADRPSVA
jgi:hypothetical protein